MIIKTEKNSGTYHAARWAPLYLEPIQGSGERLTVAILLSDEQGVRLHRVVSGEVFHHLYGSQGAHLNQMVDLVKNLINSAGIFDIENLYIPVSGFQTGRWTTASSANAEAGVLRQAIYQSASLASLAALESDLTEATEANSRWATQVKRLVISVRPDLKGSFDKKISLVDGGVPPVIDFVYARKGAQLHKIGKKISSARAKLFNLRSVLRQNHLDEGFLILNIDQHLAGNDDSEKFGAELLELRHEAEHDGTRIYETTDAEQARDVVLKLAA